MAAAEHDGVVVVSHSRSASRVWAISRRAVCRAVSVNSTSSNSRSTWSAYSAGVSPKKSQPTATPVIE
jgi:hypothetical protein